MNIERFPGNAAGRSRAVTFDNLVFTVATAPGSTSLQEQTRQVLARIEQSLRDAGSDKTRLLSATVYLTDIARKAIHSHVDALTGVDTLHRQGP